MSCLRPSLRITSFSALLLVSLLTAFTSLSEKEKPPTQVHTPAQTLYATDWRALPDWSNDDLVASVEPLRQSCRALAKRAQWPLWRAACEELNNTAKTPAALRAFYERQFMPYQLKEADGTTEGLITGYYEPLLRGARQQSPRFATPVLGVPPDLLTIDLASIVPDLKNRRLRGRLEGQRIVPYYSRAEIVQGERWRIAGQPILLWVEDPVEFFFLQIQGSGRVQLPDGKMVRLGYADQNGHPYRSAGAVLIERGELKAEEASMQGIQAWARANPKRLDSVLNSNPSYVFFRELPATNDPNEGPPGALAVPLTAERSIAVDPRVIPLGAPVYLATTRPNSKEPLRRLMFAQDTGGAIRGTIRADFFWGFGASAGQLAGRMKQRGEMWVLLPRDGAEVIIRALNSN